MAQEVRFCDRLWQAALADLSLQMTKATFDTWLVGTRAVGVEGGKLTVDVGHAHAVDWLSNRLDGVVLRTVQRHDASVMRMEYVVGAQPPARAASVEPEVERDQPKAGTNEIEIGTVTSEQLVVFERMAQERLRKRGFAQLTNYALLFWTRLLGPTPFLCWSTAYAIGWRDDENVRLSRPVRFSVAKLARIAAGGRTQAIRGVWRKCRYQETAGECCGRHGPGRLTEIDSQGVCRYWQPGAFDVLQAEQIGVVSVWRDKRWQAWASNTEGIGAALRRQRYRLVVYRPLPLLTPEQVARLDSVSQDEHESWLEAAGLDLDEWEALTAPSLGMLG